ncbi:MAG: CoA transferase, partial [Mycobacteriales bacterium]
GLWGMGQAMALALLTGKPWVIPPADAPSNPLSRHYTTSDGRVLAFTCLQAGKYWPLLCDTLGRPELATDPRFADHAALLANSVEAIKELSAEFATGTLQQWRERLASFSGQWAVVQDTLEAAEDPQTVANGYLQECRTAEGVPFRLVAAPVQYDRKPAVPHRAPEFNEHGDEILAALGLDWDAIVDLKVRGVVT